MIPRLAPSRAPSSLTLAFVAQLESCGFTGEMETDFADRLVAGTDNSVYQCCKAYYTREQIIPVIFHNPDRQSVQDAYF